MSSRSSKLDAETGNIIPAAGVQFRIKDADGNWVVQRQLYPSPVDITVFETAADGTLVLPEPLLYGDYTLHEVKAGVGYLLNASPIPFSVGKDGETVVVECANTPVMGKITVKKTGSDLHRRDRNRKPSSARSKPPPILGYPARRRGV